MSWFGGNGQSRTPIGGDPVAIDYPGQLRRPRATMGDGPNVGRVTVAVTIIGLVLTLLVAAIGGVWVLGSRLSKIESSVAGLVEKVNAIDESVDDLEAAK